MNCKLSVTTDNILGDPAEIVRFGKRVSINKMTNKELLEDHLKEMRQHLIEKKHQRDLQI